MICKVCDREHDGHIDPANWYVSFQVCQECGDAIAENKRHSQKTRLYLAGPMTGIADWNYPRFNETAALLRNKGYSVFNPAETDNGSYDKSREFYMREALKGLLSCDAIALLPGWEDSRGVSLEVLVAGELGMPVFDTDTMERIEVDIHRATQVLKPSPVPLVEILPGGGVRVLAEELSAHRGAQAHCPYERVFGLVDVDGSPLEQAIQSLSPDEVTRIIHDSKRESPGLMEFKVQSKRLIIGISGKMRSGKDTLAQMLIEEWGAGMAMCEPLQRVGLADALKVEYYQEVFAPNLGSHALNPSVTKDRQNILHFINSAKNTPGHRRGLIDYGQAKKKDDQYYWVKRALEVPGNLVIPDIRYQCEVDYLLRLDAKGEIDLWLIRVDTDNEVRAQRGPVACENDPSETELDDFQGWDWFVGNNGIKDWLQDSAKDFWKYVVHCKKRTPEG